MYTLIFEFDSNRTHSTSLCHNVLHLQSRLLRTLSTERASYCRRFRRPTVVTSGLASDARVHHLVCCSDRKRRPRERKRWAASQRETVTRRRNWGSWGRGFGWSGSLPDLDLRPRTALGLLHPTTLMFRGWRDDDLIPPWSYCFCCRRLRMMATSCSVWCNLSHSHK